MHDSADATRRRRAFIAAATCQKVSTLGAFQGAYVDADALAGRML